MAAPGLCTGDDAAEPNDGPLQATVVTGTNITGSLCSSPTTPNMVALEADWYRITLDGLRRFNITWTHAPDLDLDAFLYNMAGQQVARGISTEQGSEVFSPANRLPAGDYYLEVEMFGPPNVPAAVAYAVAVETVECADSFDCIGAAGEPVCVASACAPGPTTCVGDDAGDDGGGDDGPGGARDISGTINASLCNSPGSEVDYYRATVTAGQGLDISVSFADGQDFDLVVLNSQGVLMGQGFWQSPETVNLTYLPAGTYYIATTVFVDPATMAVIPYSITVNATAAQVCTSRADCGAEAETQIFRGDCVAGVCQPQAPATPLANGMGCDSNNDCAGGFCSLLTFDTDPADAVCSASCTTTADCTAIGPGLVCSTGFTTNFCLPACASDSECGVLNRNLPPTPGDAWAYLSCDEATGACSPRPAPPPPSVN